MARKVETSLLIEEYKDSFEIYRCFFCDYAVTMITSIEDHYYFNHAEDLEDFQGYSLTRKVELMVINSDKDYFEWIYPEFCEKVKKKKARGGRFS